MYIMKLIKLNNRSEVSGRFTNQFNTNIIIKPMSEIALLNCSINITTENIVVDTTNNTFTLEVSAAISRNVELTIGTYTWDAFRDELNRALNASLVFNGLSDTDYMSGFQLKPYKKGNKLYIAFDRSDTNGYSLDTISTVTNMTYTAGSTNWQKTAGVDGTWDSWVESNRYFTAGCGMMKIHIVCPAQNMTTPGYADYRFMIGLRSIEGAITITGQRQPADCDYAIYCGLNTASNANVYYIKYIDEDGNSQIIETASSIVNGHKVYIKLTEGKLQLQILNNADTLVHLTEVILDAEFYKEHRYSVVGLKRNTSECTAVLFHSDPYHKQSVGLEAENYYNNSEKDHNGVDDDTMIGAIVPTRVRIRMNNASLALLGFSNNPTFQQTIRGGFIADQHIDESYLPDNIKIELENISITGYDSYTKSERNILACIPKIHYNEATSGNVAYATDYPIWMDINNAQSMTINSLKIAVLNYKNELQKLSPNETDLTILVRDGNKNVH